jgi:hypothetical protein
MDNPIIFISSRVSTGESNGTVESNGKLPLKTCPGCSVSEPYQSPDWALVPAKPAQGLNTHYYYYYYYRVSNLKVLLAPLV